MNRMLAILPVLLLALWSCGEQSLVSLDQCNSTGSSADQRISACTRLLTPGQLSSRDRASAFHERGVAWAEKRDYDRAIADYNEALRINPLYAFAYYHRFIATRDKHGDAGSNTGRNEAPPPVINPQDAAGYNKRGIAWAEKRDYDRAIADYNEALRINPKHVGVNNSAAWLLATAPVAAVRNGARAVELARKATELSESKDADILDTLAAAYAEAGVYSEAVRWQEKALEFPEFAKTQGDAARKRIELYRKGQPYHQPAKP